ncbi:hypothetical protein C8R44DRAFT_292392 [Mycena epipterygia]|nr:hypothetical protein C8R44DRAFT_292392 [Mycena epipterygia]
MRTKGWAKQLNRQSERWNVVELLIPERDPFVFDQVRGRLPGLEKLCLTIESPPCCRVFYRCASTEGGLPDLMIGLCCGSSLMAPTYKAQLPRFHRCRMHRATSTLLSPRRLLFVGYETHCSGESILSFAPIAHHRLSSFKIEGPSHFDTLRLLTSPNLRQLRVDLELHDIEILSSFLTRSSCRLQNIWLWNIDDEKFLHCLPLLSTLVSLKITTCQDFLTDRLLSRFTHDLTVFPKLQTLDIDVDVELWASPGLLKEMILSRCLGLDGRDVRLETFRLVYKPDLDSDEDETGLMALASELNPLIALRMVKFEISPDSETWA